MNTTLEKKINQKRRQRVLRTRLLKVMLCYFEHEDAGKAEKHERVVNKLRKSIAKA
jgi:hypothetical protein